MKHDVTMKTTDFIAQWESFRGKAYWDGTGKVWTCGYGHTRQVTKDTTCTKKKAMEWMMGDTAPIARYLNSLDMNISQEQFDALVSFAYNVGLGNLRKSTLLRLVRHSAPKESVMGEFRKWTRSGGKVMEGLCIRREGEAMLYGTGKYATWDEARYQLEKRRKGAKG